MGSKGTTTQQGASTYTPNQSILNSGNQALGMAQNAVQQPFSLPVQQYAGFNPQQQLGFQQTQQYAQAGQPYFQQANQYFNQSAQPISSQQINQYLNPYASNVIGQLQNQQQQQMADLTGKATQAAGGVGADRIAVAQSQLANQQNLATGQTLAGIYGSALGAAQQDAQRQQAAGYGIGNLGATAQNSALSGAAANYGMGAQQQNLAQNQLNAQYANTLAQLAYPYQNTQFLAGITGGLAGAMGGTTFAQQNTTPPPPNVFSQLAGLGTAGTGLAGAFGAFGNSGSLGASALSGEAPSNAAITNASEPQAAQYEAMFGASGGRVGYDDGGAVQTDSNDVMPTSWMHADKYIPNLPVQSHVNQPQVHFSNPTQQQSTLGTDLGNIGKAVAAVAPLFAARGGAVDTPFAGYDDGGEIPFDQRFNDAATMGEMPRAMALKHYLQEPGGITAPTMRDEGMGMLKKGQGYPLGSPDFRGELGIGAVNPGNPVRTYGKTDPSGTNTGSTMPASMPGKRIAVTGGTQEPEEQPFKPTPNDMSATQAQVGVPYPDLNLPNDESRKWARSPWLALMNAGFGMMAGKSPYAFTNIGAGLLEGSKTLEQQRKDLESEEGINQRARQLSLEAQKHIDQYTKIPPGEQERLNIAKETLEQNKWQLIYDQNGVPYWSKQGEKPVPALPNAPVSNGPVTNGPVGKPPVIAQAGFSPTSPKFDYNPPDENSGPGQLVRNPKTGMLAPEHIQLTRLAMERAAKAGEAANDASVQLGHLKAALDQIDEANKSGLLATGAYAKQRYEIAKTINTVASMVDPNWKPLDANSIASGEEASKVTTRLGFALSRTLGAREAQQIVQQSIAANPGIENTPEGRKFIMATIEAGIQRQQEYQQYINDYQKKWGTAANAESEFNKANPPEKYIAKVARDTAPAEFRKPEVFEKAVNHLRDHHDDPAVVATFNKIYHNTAPYFLKGIQ